MADYYTPTVVEPMIPLTAATIRSESTHALFDRFYEEAAAKGEISHGDS